MSNFLTKLLGTKEPPLDLEKIETLIMTKQEINDYHIVYREKRIAELEAINSKLVLKSNNLTISGARQDERIAALEATFSQIEEEMDSWELDSPAIAIQTVRNILACCERIKE